MTLKELKLQLVGNDLQEQSFIFVYKDNCYVINQYINKISELLDKSIHNVSCIEDIPLSRGLFSTNDDVIYVCDVEKLEELHIDFTEHTNIIIVCKKVDVQVQSEYANYIYNFDKLKEWQLEDFASIYLKGLSANQIKWLCKVSDYDVYKIKNECDKLNIFNENERESMFNLINSENGYRDLSDLTIYDLTNAILKRDVGKIKSVLYDIEVIDVEPLGLITILINNFNKILQMQLNKNITAEDLGIQQKQFNAIKWNCNKFSPQQVLDMYEKLLDIDYKLKSGFLDGVSLLDYVLVNVIY